MNQTSSAPDSGARPPMRPLRGIRVLDFSRSMAGPIAAQALGDLGADVIKIESTGQGDETRGWPPFKGPGLGAVFLTVNRNKRSIAIDLKSPEGIALAQRMAGQADVVIESFGTGVAERLGIDARTLCSLNARLIHCSIAGFGRSGPLSGQPGYDVILQAFCGIMAITGDEQGGHIRSPVSPIDQLTGANAVSGILAALMERNRTGQGGTVELSLFDSALGLQRYNLMNYWISGIEPPKCGSGHESLCPYQAFEALDGPLLLGVANDNLWRKFCALADLGDMVDDPRYVTNAQRAAHRAAVVTRVQAVIATRPVAWWLEQLAAIGVPCSPIHSVGQLLAHPHTAARDIVVEYDHPAAGPTWAVTQPYILNDAPREVGLPPPLHAAHTAAVLAEFGIDAAAIDALRERQVIA